MSEVGYTIEPFPPFRQLIIDGLDLGSRKHRIHALVEMDISEARDPYPEDPGGNWRADFTYGLHRALLCAGC